MCQVVLGFRKVGPKIIGSVDTYIIGDYEDNCLLDVLEDRQILKAKK